MPEKKVSYFTEMARTANQALVYARIDKLVNSDATHVKAYATVNLGGSFSVHGVKVVDSQKGLFVQMPQTSYKKDGKITYQDIFHPTTAAAREEINKRVLEAYQQKIAETYGQTPVPEGGEYPIMNDVDPENPFGGQDIQTAMDMGL